MKDRIVINGKLFVRCGRGLTPVVGAAPVDREFLGFFNVAGSTVRLFDRVGGLRGVLRKDTLGIHEAHYLGDGRARYFHGGSAWGVYEWLGYASSGDDGRECLLLGVEEERALVRGLFAELGR